MMKIKPFTSVFMLITLLALLPGGLGPQSSAARAAQAPEDSSTLFLPIATRTTLQPGAGKIVFASKRDKNWEIYSMTSTGLGVDQLTNSTTTTNNHPVWSPDGTRIAYHSNSGGDFEIYVMDADGGNKVQATDNTTNDYDPVWSPDGKKIAFVSERNSTTTDTNPEIYVMDATKAGLGNNQKRLTDNTADDLSPAWSPDGTELLFVSTRDDSAGDLYVMDSDGSDQTRFLKEPGEQSSPDWMDNRIVFQSDAGGNFDIYVINTNGTGKVNLTNDPSGDTNPAWSPDGNQIIFSSDRVGDGIVRLYITGSDGLGVLQITNPANSDTSPDWHP